MTKAKEIKVPGQIELWEWSMIEVFGVVLMCQWTKKAHYPFISGGHLNKGNKNAFIWVPPTPGSHPRAWCILLLYDKDGNRAVDGECPEHLKECLEAAKTLTLAIFKQDELYPGQQG